MPRQLSRMDTAEDDKRRAQAEALRAIDASRRQEIENRRGLCTGLRFWEFCPDRRCKRARQCAGDVGACFDRIWPHVPDNLKNKIRQAIVFVNRMKRPTRPSTMSAGASASTNRRWRAR